MTNEGNKIKLIAEDSQLVGATHQLNLAANLMSRVWSCLSMREGVQA